MCNATWPDAAVDAIKTLMDSLIEISAIAGVAHKHAARESECISHYLAFVQLKADQALDQGDPNNWLSAFKIPPRRLVKINVASLAGA